VIKLIYLHSQLITALMNLLNQVFIITFSFILMAVSTKSAGLSFFIPERIVKYPDTLPHFTCSFTAEYYAIMTALKYINS